MILQVLKALNKVSWLRTMQLRVKKFMTKRDPKVLARIDLDLLGKKDERQIPNACRTPHNKYRIEISCQSAITSIDAKIPNMGFLKYDTIGV